MVDGRLCVVVEGPHHCVQVPATIGDQTETGFVPQRRTKDRFVDHMLHQWGYQVFRLPDTRDQAVLHRLVCELRAALAPSGASQATPGQEESGVGTAVV